MKVAFDNTFLTLVLNPNSKPPVDPSTKQPVSHCKERIEALIDRHSASGDTVLVPTPCLAELLTAVPDVAKVIAEIDRSTAFETTPFDARSAIELGLQIQDAIKKGDKKGGVKAGWQEVKFDRQIATIAKVNGAQIFYTDDENQGKFALQLGMQIKHTWDLDLPPKYAQRDFIKDGD